MRVEDYIDRGITFVTDTVQDVRLNAKIFSLGGAAIGLGLLTACSPTEVPGTPTVPTKPSPPPTLIIPSPSPSAEASPRPTIQASPEVILSPRGAFEADIPKTDGDAPASDAVSFLRIIGRNHKLIREHSNITILQTGLTEGRASRSARVRNRPYIDPENQNVVMTLQRELDIQWEYEAYVSQFGDPTHEELTRFALLFSGENELPFIQFVKDNRVNLRAIAIQNNYAGEVISVTSKPNHAPKLVNLDR